MGEVFLLALLASLNPTLLGATTVMLLLDRPARLMLGYLFGALLTSNTLGLVIVFSFSDSSATSTTEHTLNPAVDIAFGALLLGLAWSLRRGGRLAREREQRREARKDKGPPRWQRALSRGSPRTTFVIGALLTLPGASYLAGLLNIHQLHYSAAETVLLVIAFNLVMLWLLEVPLICFAVAPDWTPHAVDRARAWVSRHVHVVMVRGLTILGTLLLIKGLIGLIR
jgi:hypothetical protein